MYWDDQSSDSWCEHDIKLLKQATNTKDVCNTVVLQGKCGVGVCMLSSNTDKKVLDVYMLVDNEKKCCKFEAL